MPFIGNKPASVPLTSADIADSIITSAKIVDGTIALVDIICNRNSRLVTNGLFRKTTHHWKFLDFWSKY
jgi:hypothetical protein